MAIFDDLQYCKSVRFVSGPKNIKKRDNVILEWSLAQNNSHFLLKNGETELGFLRNPKIWFNVKIFFFFFELAL